MDTNVLLRLANTSMPGHLVCRHAIVTLHLLGIGLHFTLQNASEFWNVATRPVDRNGFGLAAKEAALRWAEVELFVSFLPDDARVYAVWHSLVTSLAVRGVQVHDAKLAAAMQVHGAPAILTFNVGDFTRFPGLQAIHPSEVEGHP